MYDFIQNLSYITKISKTKYNEMPKTKQIIIINKLYGILFRVQRNIQFTDNTENREMV